MDNLIHLACDHYFLAQWIFVLGILLAGINIPISLDVALITAGAFASTCSKVNPIVLFIFLFLAAWVSAWEAYWIGRIFGPKLYNFRWFNHVLNPLRVQRLHDYYEKFGFLTFMVGRFIPGGIRNALFMTSGLGKMPFYLFVMRDFPACLASCGFLYYLGYTFGQNYKIIVSYFEKYNLIVIAIIGIVTALYFLLKRKK